jgi:hypothetical protein
MLQTERADMVTLRLPLRAPRFYPAGGRLFGSGPTWSTGNGRNRPITTGGRQLSRDGTSRVSREAHARICEGLGVKFPGPTRHSSVGFPTAGTCSSSQWRPNNEFETDTFVRSIDPVLADWWRATVDVHVGI